jgi:D-glycero-D-manno-heptose 1,7-bisphosphate phosphatase
VSRAVFLDRDGVIVEPVHDELLGTPESPYRPQDVRLVDGAAEAIAELRARGWLLVGVSNQPAAAKGNATLEDLRAVHERAAELLAAAGAELDDWRYCFHHPDGVVEGLSGPCGCRKPAPGLLLEAAADHDIDLARSWMVGDSGSDIAAGVAAGTSTVLVEHPATGHRRGAATAATITCGDLSSATSAIAARCQPAEDHR